MPLQAKALAAKPHNLTSFSSQDPCGERKEQTASGCPPTSMHSWWYAHTKAHTDKLMNK